MRQHSSHKPFQRRWLVSEITHSRPQLAKVYEGRLFYLSFLSDKTATNVPKAIISDSASNTLTDRETFLQIIPCSHRPHLAGDKTATALKTSC